MYRCDPGSVRYGEFIGKSTGLLEMYGDRIVLPVDLAQVVEGRREEARIDRVPKDFNAVDIGSETACGYAETLMKVKTVFANGPLGVFEAEASEYGTKVLFEALARTPAYTVVGGGDSVTAAKKYGATEKIDYMCTGGGALIRFLTGEELPVVKALRHAASAFRPQ